MPIYQPSHDYSTYAVTEVDGPFLTTRAAARRLGHQQTEAVRRLAVSGRLPHRRAHTGYNAPIEIPQWALDGWIAYRGLEPVAPHSVANEPSNDREPHQALRVRELEQALLVLRAAAEHERNARRLVEEALRESGRANDLLADSLGAVVVPSSLGT